jgi:CRISPR-associated protein Csx14
VTNPDPTIRINVDITNPGQFFACCGLLELADRLWPGAEGWFDGDKFCINAGDVLTVLMRAVAVADVIQLDPNDDTSSAIEIGAPFRSLRVDWWQDARSGGKQLKVWAGTMESFRIARAMQGALRAEQFAMEGLLDVGMVVYDPENHAKKVEPFYFDARRGPNAHSRDVGFSPNDLQLTTTAFPAVEFLCLVGLQRCLPAATGHPRVYDYFSWPVPTLPELLRPIVAGELLLEGDKRFRFENWYRTGQRKHKAFRSAIPVPEGDR